MAVTDADVESDSDEVIRIDRLFSINILINSVPL